MLSRNFQLVTEAVRSVFHVVSVSSKVSVEELALSALALQKIMAGQNQENDFQSLAKKVLDYACGRNYFREHDLEYLKKFYHSEAKVVDQNFLRSLVGALLKLEKFKVAKKRYETARLISQKITVEQRELLDLFIVHERDVEEYGAYLKTLVLYGESGTEDATLHSSKNADKVRMQELRDPRMSLLKIARYCSERYLDSSSGESWVTNCFFKVLEIERVWVDAFLLHVEYFSRWVSECGVSVIVSRACEDGTPTAEQFYGDGKTLSVFILLLTKFVNLLGTSSQKTFILSVVERSLRRQLSHFSTGKYTVDEKTMFLSTIWINFATRTFSHLIEALEVLGKTGTAYTLLFHYFDNLSNVDSPFIIHQDMISFEIEWLHVMNIFAYRKSSLVEVSQALSPLGEQRRFSIIVNNVVRQYKELLAVFCQDVHYSSEIVKELISEFTSFIGICYMTNEGCLFQVTRSQGVESPLAEMYQSTLQAWKDSAANSQFFTNLLNILDCFMVNMARFLRQVFQSSIWSVGDAYLTATAAMISAFLAALNQMSYLDDENVKWIVLRHKRTVLEFHKLMSGREILILFSKKKLAEEIFYGSFTCELTEQTEFLESFRSFLCEYVANESDEYSHTILSSMLQIIMSAKIIIEDDSVNFERSSNCFVASVDFLDEILDSYISSLTVCPSSVHLKLVENEGIYLLSNGILRLEEEKAALANEDHCKKCSSLNRKLQVILKIFFSNETAPLISLYSDRVWRIFIMFLENEDTSDLGKDLLRRIFLGADEQENLLDLPKDFTLSETRKHCRLLFQGLLDRLEFHCFQDSVGAERKALLLRKYLSLFSSLVAESMRIMQRMFRNSRGFEIFKAIFSDSDSDFVRSIAIDLLKLLAQVTRNNPKAEFELKSLFPCNFLVHTLNSCYPEGVSSEVIAALLEVVVGSPILIRHNSDNFQCMTSFVIENVILSQDRLAFRSRLVSSSSEILCALFKLAESTSEDVQVALCNFIYTITYEDSLNASVVDASGVTEIIIERLFYSSVDSTFWSSLHLRNAYLSCLCAIIRHLVTPSMLSRLLSVSYLGSSSQFGLHDKRTLLYSEVAIFHALSESFEICKKWPRFFLDFSGNHSGLASIIPGADLTRRKDSLWLTFWFRRETISRESSLVELYTSKDSAFEVFLNELGVLCLRLHESETVFEMFHNTDTEIPPYVWVFVCLRFQRISSGKQTLIDVYLNGKLSSSSNVSKNIDRVTAIGFGCSFSWTDLSILPRASSCLKGQFGAIYCFQGNLSERTICTIYEFGPSFDSDLCDLSFSESTRDLDNLLNLSVLFLYAPRCCGDSRTCPDGSLAAVGSRKSIAARLIGSSGESRVCSVNNIIDSLHCVGGLRSVLELFFALDNFSSSTLGTDETEADSVSADVLESLNELTCYFLKIIAEILRYDKQAEIEWMNTHVFDYLGAWFFETKLSFSSKEVIDAIFQLFETCSDRKSVVSVCTKRCLSNEFLWSKMTQDVAVHFWKALCSLKDNSTLSPNVLLDVIGNFDVDSAVFVSRESRDISLCKGIIDFILLGFKMLFTNSDFVTSGNQFLVIDGATQRDGVSYLEQIEHAYSRALVENLLKPVCFHALDEMNQDAFAKLNYLLQALSSLSNFLSVSVRASCFSFLIHQDLIEVLLKVLKSTSQLRLVLFSIAALFDLFESNSDECVQWVTSQFRLSELSASMEKEEWKNHVIGGLCMFITGTLQGADADLTMLLEHLMSSDFLGGPCSTQGTIEKIRTGALPLIIMLLTKENNLIGKASMIQALVALLEESRQLTETFLCFNLWSFWIISLSRVNTFSTCDEDELFSSYVSSFKKLVVHLFKHFIEDWGMSVTTFYQVEELVFAAWNLIDATFAMQVLTWFLQCVKDIAVPLLLSQGIFGMNIGAKCSQTLESTNIEGFAMVFLFTKLICDMGNMQNAEAKQKDTRLKLEMCELCIEIILLLGLLSTSSASYSGESKVVGNDFEFLGIHVFPRSAVLDLFGKYENERRYPASRPGQNSFKLDEQTFIEPLCKGGFVRISLLFIIDALVEKLKLQEEFSYYETLLSSIGEVHGGLRVDKIWRHYVEQHFTNLISESTPNPSEISQKNELELLLGNLVKRWKQSKHSVEHKSTGFFRPFKNKSLGRNMQVLTSPTAGSEMIASLMKSEQEWNETGYACMFSAVMEWKKRVDQSFDILENISTVLSSNTHIQKDVLREVNVSEGVRNDAKSRLKASEFRKLVFGFRKHLSYQELMKDSTKTQWSLAGIMDSLQRRWLLKPTENIDTQWKRLSQSAQQMSSLSNYSEEGVTSPSRDSVTDANQKRNSDVTTITGPHLSLPVDNLSIQQFDESYQKNWSIESPEPSSASPSSSTPLLSSMELLAARTAASASDVQWSGSCIWVRFLKAVPGRLELRERSIRFLQSPFNEESERVLSPGYFVKTSSTEEDIENIQELTFPLEEIQHLEFRRFLLQHKAFEIFLQNKKSYFFALQTSRACKTCLKLLSKLLELPHNRLLPSHNTSGPRSVYAGGAFKFPRCLLDWKTVQALTADACARWKRRQLSNFEYLCILNRLAGRSNNDLCQYPIFPWILADYSTEKLDLTDPKTFRDLAKPVGCQPSTSSEEAGERERRFRERFETWADKAIPPFHYGSHYSSAAAALHYLVRVEPFTTLSLELQGGLFDHPDRMFYSLEGAWNSVTQSMQDVKELIPEFFYFPEIFRNRNGVSFGRTQDGHLIDDVLLPKWANGSPEHFVRVHREALESEYVSLNLHHWIDLIFGFRQRGPAAVEACNVFFYLTYEGAIDLESIQDMELRESMETQIAHFGQTPPQLMEDSGHPQRDHSGALLQPSYWTPQGLMAALEFSVAIGTDDSIVQICQAGDRIVSITKNQFVFRHKWIPLPDLQGSPFTFETDTKNISESAAFSSQEGNIETRRSSNREIVGGTYLASSTQASLFSLYALSFDGKVIISAGHWDWSIRCCFTSEAHKPIQCLKGHRDIVTCLSIGSDGRTLVTGSKDTTIFVWEIVWGDPERVRDPKEGKLDRSYSGGETKLGAILKVQGNVTKRRKMKVVEERPKLVLYEHEYPLVCVAVNTEVGVIASNDSCNTLMIHNLSNGHLLRILDFLKESLVDSVTVTCRNEIILVSSKKASFFLYTGNGVALKKQSICSHHDSCQILSSPTITSYTITVDGRLLFVADELNGVAVYSSWGLNLLHRYKKVSFSLVYQTEEF
ncbi:WD-40 repeat family protein / beige-related protein [Galdieria sulphuraria]|uniref:WD-40 repeat family protein / beige-related protein n=1 Tax=Galdieria sulphuraria TaxID=130081 RepID=M2Y8Y9_GALSU|nr:WD-40 repeat family protein / beige-related protein [Galdieria sulphuraria]EME32304.1 WD-40 repeat family protein / beige-related protein [Galdieria sulphuraria]|eukprot:XP_005708824.1 WD-40 repeat family protein / beige-related protein [Galdieria sulphuraria]